MGQSLRVPFGTLSVPPEVEERIVAVLRSGRLSSGRYVRELEERFAAFCGTSEAVAVSSGTDADVLALAALYDLGAERGDEVIVPALSFVATGNAVVHAGFRPAFVDVRRDTLNIDPEAIEAAIGPRTRAIMPVHLMGKPAEMDTIREIAGRHGLLVIEDAAEAHGASYKGVDAGALGDAAAFSLYAAHIVSSVEGGMITTNRDDLAEVFRSLRSHGRACACKQCVLSTAQEYCPKRFATPEGQDRRFRFDRIGYSSKMNELEAVIGLANLEHAAEVIPKRRANLLRGIEGVQRFAPLLETIAEEAHERIGPHALPIVLGEEAPFTRDELASYLEEHGVETRTLFASMPTQCPGFAYLGYKLGQFQNAEYLGLNGLHIGVHQDLELADMDYAIGVLEAFMKQRAAWAGA